MFRFLTASMPFVIATMIAGCAPPAPVPTSIMFDDGVDEQRYTATDPQFTPLNAAVERLMTSDLQLARTFYTEARFEAEIAPLPYVTVEFATSITLPAPNADSTVLHLVFVIIDDDPLLLTQALDDADWMVFLVENKTATRFTADVEAITTAELN